MVVEVRRGRVCDSLSRERKVQVVALQDELKSKNEAIRLSNVLLADKDNLIASLGKEIEVGDEIHDIEKRYLKNRLKKLWKVIIVEGGVIVVVVCILLI